MEGWRMSEVKERRAGKGAAAKSAGGAAKAAAVEAVAAEVTAPAPKAAPAAMSAAAPAAGAETVRDREMKSMEANGAGVLAVMFTFAEAAEEDKRLPMAVEAARIFLIAFAFIAPVLLLWQQVF
jgi:hypothetical protein